MPMMMSPQTGGIASALQSQGNGGMLQRLLGSYGQSGLGQRLTDILNPQVALPMAGAMIAGRTPAAGFGDALALGGMGLGKLNETRKLDAEKQRTKDYLTKSHPELAQMVDMGLPIEDAWKEALKLDHPTTSDVRYSAPTLMSKPDGSQTYVMFGDNGSMKSLDGGNLKPGKVTYRNSGTYTSVLDAGGNEIAQIPIENYQAKYDQAAGTHAGGEQGDAIAKLNTMQSMMPGLQTTVNELDDLAKKATYTTLGKGRDYLAGQVGVATEGAVARTEYINKVRTQIFPLLRSTFGAQFTVAEGDALVATMGDSDTTPEQKQAALRSFIVAKQREIEGLAKQTGQPVVSPTGGGGEDPLGIR